MIKYFLATIVITGITTTSFSQTTKQKLDQLKNNPKTIENAVKADAGLINKKKITDTSIIKNQSIKRKEQGCRSKRKNKSIRSSS